MNAVNSKKAPKLGGKTLPGGPSKPRAAAPQDRSDRHMAERHGRIVMDKCSVFEVICQRPGGRETVYCSDSILATVFPATCTMDFRPETLASKTLDLFLGVVPIGAMVTRAMRLAMEARAAAVAAAKAAIPGMKGVKAAGDAGEIASGIIKDTTRIPSASGTAAYRVPDQLTETVLGEVKNVRHLSYTAQLRDFVAYAQQQGLQMVLYVRPSTTFSASLQAQIESGVIQVVRNVQ